MKWIGQLIYDQIARFRSDIYLEGISTSTETDILVVDSSNKISKRAASGLTSGTATLASTVTVTDSTTATAFPVVFHDESNALLDDTGAFTYNPSTGTLVTPNLTVSGTTTTINTTNLNVEDKNITLNYNDSSDTSGTADGAGITIQDAVDASNDASLTWTAADDTFEFSHAVEINNGASGGTAALTIDNDDVDQIALDIDAANTIANILDINAQALTTGNAIFIDANSLAGGSAISIDVDDAQTTSQSRNLVHIDYDKAGVTGSGAVNSTNGLKIDMNDGATNHASGSSFQTAINIGMAVNSPQGTTAQTGVNVQTTDLLGLPADTWKSFQSMAPNTATSYDFYAIPAGLYMVGQEDYFAIQTTTNGATTLSTVDYSHALAHFEIAADGNITLDAAGDIALEAGGNDVTVDTDNFIIESATNHLPKLEIKSTYDGGDGGNLNFHKDRASTVVNDDVIGTISWQGDNDADESITYGYIEVSALEVDDTDEAGRMKLQVAESNGTATTVTTGLEIFGADNTTDGEVDVTIAAGAASTTTIAGTLTMGSTATLDNSGILQVAAQANITSVGTLTGLTTSGAIELGHADDTTIARSAAGKVTIEGNQVVTAGAVNVSSGSQSPIAMQVARRTITTGEANTMFTGGLSYAPIELIPAQGANTIIVPTSIMAKTDRAANQTNGSTTMDVHYDGQTGGYGSSSLFHFRRFGFGETTDYVERRAINQVTSGLTLTEDVNKAVEISFNGGAPTTDCFTSIDIFITYYVLDIS